MSVSSESELATSHRIAAALKEEILAGKAVELRILGDLLKRHRRNFIEIRLLCRDRLVVFFDEQGACIPVGGACMRASYDSGVSSGLKGTTD